MAVSHAFLNSQYISTHELPRLVAIGSPFEWRRAVPVGLEPARLDGRVDLKGLGEIQIFRDAEGKFFSERKDNSKKERFCEELFDKILAVARRHIVSPDSPPASVLSAVAAGGAELLERTQREEFHDAAEKIRFVPTKGALTDLDKLKLEAQAIGEAGERRDAIEFLLEWARDESAPSLCALLGDSGIGKMTTCRVLTQRLLDARYEGKDRSAPDLSGPAARRRGGEAVARHRRDIASRAERQLARRERFRGHCS